MYGCMGGRGAANCATFRGLDRQRGGLTPSQIKEDVAIGRSALVDAAKHIETVNLAPDGERSITVARGDLFSVPAKNGTPRNLTKTSGAHERDAVWSPDGKWIAYN